MSNKILLVPHDFSEVADNATQHALQIARQIHARVLLLHVSKSERDKASAEEKFDGVLTALNLGEADPKVNYTVVPGTIFEAIADVAKKTKAALIVMGTHGAKGMQKVMGSYALKVITSSSTPFLIVQKEGPAPNINRIVLPVDLSKESVQIMGVAVALAKAFHSDIHVVGPHETDAHLSRKIIAHIGVVRNQLQNEELEHHVELLKGSSALHTKVLEYGKANNTSMYAIAYHTESLLPQFDRFAQSILTNDDGTPVLIINSKEVSSLYF